MATDPESRLGRAVQTMAGTSVFLKIGPRIVPPIDRALDRLSGGRFMMSRLMLPCAVLTTTGRRTGLPRESPLAAVPLDEDLYVVGSNFGQQSHPAWSWNLIDDPHATVSFEGERYPVVARLLGADETHQVWPHLIARWPLFDQYVQRSGRELRVFRLVRDSPGRREV